MGPTDALFWALDLVPELRSTMGALLILERGPAHERLRDTFLRVVAGMPRMRQRVVETPLNLAAPEWLDDPEFDLDYHLRTIAVPPPRSMADLLAELGPLFATPLDRDRPLWEAYYADGLVDDRAAVFVMPLRRWSVTIPSRSRSTATETWSTSDSTSIPSP